MVDLQSWNGLLVTLQQGRSLLFGNASVIEFNSDTGSFENLLYVQEDVSDTKEQLETKLDNPDEIILDRICDEVFGDG